ncbi:hypothetical protein FRC17_006006 [Serendipita sp. 399]|nr:hypothetical protein FRC17_006006 [Serendipita sp. 399]
MSTSSATNGYQAMEQSQIIIPTPTVSLESSQIVSGDPLSKKRKREESLSAADGRPLAKQARSESPVRYAEDMPLTPLDAHKVLTILETIDTDGLLDRLIFFPPGSSTRSSFRSILQDQAAHSLRIIRSALNQLLPSSSHPRSLIAVGASNQQHFCDFAQGLFNQISTHNTGILGTTLDDAKLEADDSTVGKALLPEERKRKYALVQRLPTGDWWSSATVQREGDVGLTRNAAKALTTGQAELVSIIPSQPIPTEDMPSFSSLKQIPVFKAKDDPRRSVNLPGKSYPAPKLLDYGVYSTFAPYFDSESAELGNDQIHSIVSESMQRRRARALRTQLLEKVDKKAQIEQIDQSLVSPTSPMKEESGPRLGADEEMKEHEDVDSNSIGRAFDTLELMQTLRNIVPEGENEALKQAFSALQAELGVSELLEENAIALDNLVRMQTDRIKRGDWTPSALEREIAQGITSSLSLLVSLRPRAGSRPGAVVTPSATILRALHRSLPTQATSGWRGTLANNRTSSLRDDATMYVKATSKTQAAASAAVSNQHQVNGNMRIPSTPVPATPTAQSSLYSAAVPQPHTPASAMRYSYQQPMSAQGYPTPSPSNYSSVPGGNPRVIPNVMNHKGNQMSPSGPWPGYPHSMPPYMATQMPPVTPIRGNAPLNKQFGA